VVLPFCNLLELDLLSELDKLWQQRASLVNDGSWSWAIVLVGSKAMLTFMAVVVVVVVLYRAVFRDLLFLERVFCVCSRGCRCIGMCMCKQKRVEQLKMNNVESKQGK